MREDLPVLDKIRKDKQQYQPANRYQIQMYCCCPGKDLCSNTALGIFIGSRKFSMCKDTRVERISPNYLFDIRSLFLTYCLISQCVLPCISYALKTYYRLCFVVDWPKKKCPKKIPALLSFLPLTI